MCVTISLLPLCPRHFRLRTGRRLIPLRGGDQGLYGIFYFVGPRIFLAAGPSAPISSQNSSTRGPSFCFFFFRPRFSFADGLISVPNFGVPPLWSPISFLEPPLDVPILALVSDLVLIAPGYKFFSFSGSASLFSMLALAPF